ncbi:hypothetical protein [Rossellomorea aquimaris]|uniref:hypothetical protein n=1 Tax=Rossellomorea aquimaris TaxID=189382 RepID=UPI000ABAE54D|nr:hypothetical protein [Rossellomorea aquimaris]
MMFKGCLYCGHTTINESELFMKEEYGDQLVYPHGQRLGGNVAIYSCGKCGFVHPFIKEKRKKFEKEAVKGFNDIRWNIR